MVAHKVKRIKKIHRAVVLASKQFRKTFKALADDVGSWTGDYEIDFKADKNWLANVKLPILKERNDTEYAKGIIQGRREGIAYMMKEYPNLIKSALKEQRKEIIGEIEVFFIKSLDVATTTDMFLAFKKKDWNALKRKSLSVKK